MQYEHELMLVGAGIYFTANPVVAYKYAVSGNRGFMLAVRVALGKVKDFQTISPRLCAPPAGYDSCRGVVASGSDFKEEEYVVYSGAQQQLEYIVEFS